MRHHCFIASSFCLDTSPVPQSTSFSDIFPQQKVVGILNSERGRVRPSFQDVLFSEPLGATAIILVFIRRRPYGGANQ